MLQFPFPLYGTGGNAVQLGPRDNVLVGAFEVAQELANEPNTPLRRRRDLAQVLSTVFSRGWSNSDKGPLPKRRCYARSGT